jgi:hypothetical protein
VPLQSASGQTPTYKPRGTEPLWLYCQNKIGDYITIVSDYTGGVWRMLLLSTSTRTETSTKKIFITCEFFQWLAPLRRLDLCRRGEGKKEPTPTLPTAFGNRLSHAWRRSQRSFAISRCRLLPDNWLANGNLYETLDLSCNFARCL